MKKTTASSHALIPAFALLCFLSFTGCEKTVARTDYFPLRDGNRWDYRLLDMPLLKRMESGQNVSTERNASAAGASADSDLSASAQFIDPNAVNAKNEAPPARSNTAAAEDRSVASARRVTLELRDSIKSLYDTAEQVWSKRNGYVGFQSPRGRNYLLMLPPHTGYKWVVTGSAGQELFYQIESASVSIDTPAGKFDNCVLSRQESRDRKEVFKYWFAPNVGLVRRSKYFADEEVFRQELVEYKVQPATPATRLEEDREVRRAIEGKNRGSEFRDKAREARDERPYRRGYVPPPHPDDEENEKVQQLSDPK
jgi:hypothetical protein